MQQEPKMLKSIKKATESWEHTGRETLTYRQRQRESLSLSIQADTLRANHEGWEEVGNEKQLKTNQRQQK